ncbi:MAG TPA: hypothetical protein ENK56_02480 [Chloroflexi bacterium]|nr:hypothetical protein [Chloroflexota bacterium]
MMGELTLPLDRIEGAHRPRVGGKGYALSRLRQAGFPVPPGFVVTADAYRAFVAANGLGPLLAEALIADDPVAAARAQAAFQEAEMPSEIAAAIGRAYRAMGAGPVAVRSSAVAEDGDDASFAGQYETVLEVIGEGVLLAAVRRCWASLWSARALAYRRALGLETEPAMAVVVQRMVDAAQAGVAFTRDPVSGRRDVVVVEAVAGSGERLVSGEAKPRRYVVRREEEGTALGDGLLDGTRLAAVVRLARRVEAWAGRPQDVEWAVDRAGRVYLLQARPVTAAGPPRRAAVRWTRDNVGEVIPDPVTPLSWSVLEPLTNGAFRGVLRRLGVGQLPGRLFARFYGRVYLNQTLFQAVMSRFYLSRAGWLALPRLAWTGLCTLRQLLRLPGEAREAGEAVRERAWLEEGMDPSVLVPVGLLARIDGWHRLERVVMEVHLAVTTVAELLYQALDKGLSRWGDGSVTVATLTAGLTGVRSAEVGRALAELARWVRRDGDLCALVCGIPPGLLRDRLAETGPGRALWARIEAFLAEHGHGAEREFELAAPRWREDPTPLLAALQAQVRAADREIASDPIARRLAATARIERRLGPAERLLFRLLLRRAQIFTQAREDLKYHFVLAHDRLRKLYRALGVRLAAEGYLVGEEDVFFLTVEEVVELVGGGLPGEEVRRRAIGRRRMWEGYRRVVAPPAIEEEGGRVRPVEAEGAGAGDGLLLRGLAASPGTYIGRARVVRTLEEGAGMEPGEVLIALATSPGWAPLLVAAGALVTEIGGTLSHGAIIAREYGLPAVLNVPGATRHIHTGQLVRVDGSLGTVRLLEERETIDTGAVLEAEPDVVVEEVG